MRKRIHIPPRRSEPHRPLIGGRRTALILLGAAAGAVAVGRRVRRIHSGRRAPGGILIGNAALYDAQSRLLLGSFLRGIAADVATAAADGSRVLEVGCGPGHLSIRLARRHGLDVTGLDLDPGMIQRARANAESGGDADERGPSFFVGDVAALPFPDASFDLVVSTLSMHHWADPRTGLGEIGRVLRPGARALVWDIRPGILSFHARVPDPVELMPVSSLRVLSATPWRWPWNLKLSRRIELLRSDGSAPSHP